MKHPGGKAGQALSFLSSGKAGRSQAREPCSLTRPSGCDELKRMDVRWDGCVRMFEPCAAGLCLKPRAWRPPICGSGLGGVTVAFQEVSPSVTSSPFRCPRVPVLWVSHKGKQVLVDYLVPSTPGHLSPL